MVELFVTALRAGHENALHWKQSALSLFCFSELYSLNRLPLYHVCATDQLQIDYLREY